MFKPLKAVALLQLNDRPPRMYGHAKQVYRGHEPSHGDEPAHVVYATWYALGDSLCRGQIHITQTHQDGRTHLLDGLWNEPK